MVCRSGRHLLSKFSAPGFPGQKQTGGREKTAVSEETGGFQLWADGGAEEIRTPDPHNAIVVLYQLSYDPIGPKAARTLWVRSVVSKGF